MLPVLLLTTVWTTDATTKVRPSDPPRVRATIAMEAARNEFEAAQIVVSGGATNVRMTATLAGFPQDTVTLYREALLNISMPSNSGGAAGAWPDPLVPDHDAFFGETRNAFPFDVPAGQNRAVWLEVLVPPGQAAGHYGGNVHISADGFATDVPFSIEVWPFTLPSTPSLQSAFGNAWNGPCVAHGTNCGDDAQNARWHIMYAQFALDHRLTIRSAVQFGPAPSGSGFDWASWDATYAPLFDGTMATRLPGARLTTIQFDWVRDAAHYAAWAQHFRAKGWFDRTFDYTCDEPPLWGCGFGDIPGLISAVHQGDPQFRTLVTTSLPKAQQNGIAGSVDILVPVVDEVNPRDPDVNRTHDYVSWQGANPNREVWWYFSCEPASSCANGVVGGGPGWPNYIVDAPAIENRIMGFLSYHYGITTELYYNTMVAMASGDPWASVYSYGNNGDGNLFYPGKVSLIGGTHDIPVASIRLKMAREAREDYEYLRILADAGDPTLAAQLAAQVAPKTWQFTEDPNVLYAARRQAAQRIVALKGGQQNPGTYNGPRIGGNQPSAVSGGSSASEKGSVVGGCDATPGHVDARALRAILLLLAVILAWRRAARR
jgi:hypothetical protein